MKTKRGWLAFAIIAMTLVAGCAPYRTSSNIESEPAATAAAGKIVIIAEDALLSRKYKALGPIEVSVKKLTLFHKDPTKEQADEALIEKARVIGADAVINVTYKAGIGFTTWGYIDAAGTGVKLAD